MVAVQARAGIREGPAWPLAGGIIAGVVLDAVFGDPRRGHPVAVFGRAAQALQDRVYRDSVPHGAGYAALCIYGPRHPSPNAGRCEAAFADALGVRLGGTNTYGGVTEERQWLGDGRGPEPADIATAVRLCRADDCGCGDRCGRSCAGGPARGRCRAAGAVKGALLVAGTGSDAGQSITTAGLCRWLWRQGVSSPRSRPRTCHPTRSSSPMARRSARRPGQRTAEVLYEPPIAGG
jgi:hypothetical protein